MSSRRFPVHRRRVARLLTCAAMRFAPLALLATCLVVFFTGLREVGFMDEREARDACVARELIERHEVLTPILGHEPLDEKPLLAYAPEVAGALLTPGSPFGPRALKAVLAVALVLLTGMIGAQHLGPRAGWWAAAALATSFALPLAARADGTQLLASLLGWIGCAGLADGVFGRRPGRERRLVVAYGALGATLVCAGPLPALWPLAAVALYLKLSRTQDRWRTLQPWSGLAILIGLSLPWYGSMIERQGIRFLAHAPFFPYGVEARQIWYTGPVRALALLIVGFFPWSTLLPGAALHAAMQWRARRRAVFDSGSTEDRPSPAPLERERREESAAHFFIACLAAALGPVLFYPAAPLSAGLPALPAAALICGRLLDHVFEDPARVKGAIASAVRMLAMVGGAAAVMLAVIATRVREPAAALRALSASLLVTSCAPFLAEFIGRRRVAAALLTLPVAIGAPVVAHRVLPVMEDYLGARDVAEAMNSASPPHATLLLAEPPPPSLRYYLDRNLAYGAPLPRALERFRAVDGLAYLAFRPSREDSVARLARAPIEIMLRTPSLVLARVHRREGRLNVRTGPTGNPGPKTASQRGRGGV